MVVVRGGGGGDHQVAVVRNVYGGKAAALRSQGEAPISRRYRGGCGGGRQGWGGLRCA